MRIISGKYKGRRLKIKAPKGVRPTADNVRESIFNILENNIEFSGASVLDICAGTGAMGFEALSRGAGNAVFIEKNRKTASLIKNTADMLSLPDESFDVIISDAAAFLKKQSFEKPASFDIVFFDPPYHSDIYSSVIYLLKEKNFVDKRGIVSVESSALHRLPCPSGWEIISEKKYGSKKVTLFEV